MMKPLLSIDTASAKTTVALRTGEHISSRSTDRQRQAAQQVLPLLQELLNEHGLEVSELGGIAVVNGPGSFTGMRIGVAVAQGLARAASVPVVAISSLAAMAASAAELTPGQDWLVAMHARESEHYLAAYRTSRGQMPELLVDEQVVTPVTLPAALSGLPASDSWRAVGNSFADEAFMAALNVPLTANLGDLSPNPASVLRLLELALAGAADGRPEQALPNYVKEQMDYS